MLWVNEGKVHIMVMYMLDDVVAVMLGPAAISSLDESDWRIAQGLSKLLKQHCIYSLANQLHMLQMPH